MDKMKEDFIKKVDFLKEKIENVIRDEINDDAAVIEDEVEK